MDLFDELKRRNVVRVASLYLVAAWVVLQVADILFEAMELEASAMRVVIAVLVIGFPIAIALSWFFEITPDGIKRESEIVGDTAAHRSSGRKLNIVLTVLLVIAIAMIAEERFGPEDRATDSGESAGFLSDVDQNSIAVLPFANRSANEDDVYFVDGMHDDILTQLARIDSLSVTSRTSVERFRDTTMSLPEIARDLDVRNVLEGGIQRAGSRVRINMKLIDASTSDTLWANTFQKELTASNLFDVQSEIAMAVTEAMQVTLQGEDVAELNARPTNSIEAYDLYLLGRFHWNKRTEESLEEATRFFEQATTVDPEFVLAWSGLADSYTLRVEYGGLSGDVAFPLVQEAIDRAMALDDSVSEVWASQGLLLFNQVRFPEAEAALLKALELDDKNFSAWGWYGSVMLNLRRYKDAEAAFQSAYALEPLSQPVNNNLANLYLRMGEFTQARTHFSRLAQARPDRADEIELQIIRSLQAEGRLAQAIERYRASLAKDSNSLFALLGLGDTYVVLGDLTLAREWYARAEVVNSFTPNRIVVHELEGDFDAAILLMEDIMLRLGTRQGVVPLASLFRSAYLKGDYDTAMAYLTERLAVVGGRVEINPIETEHYDELLVADFYINHGERYGLDPARGEEMLEAIYNALLVLREQGHKHPNTLGSLALAAAQKGDSLGALEYLNLAVDSGLRGLDYVLLNPVMQGLLGTPEMVAVQARVAASAEVESELLATLTLAPYVEPEDRQPIVLNRDELRRYEGLFTDGNVMYTSMLLDDGSFVLRFAQQQQDMVLLPYESGRFFTPIDKSIDVSFEEDDDGALATLVIQRTGNLQRLKPAEPYPEAVVLDSDILERYVGTWGYLQPGSSGEDGTGPEYLLAEISFDEDGTVWLDFNNQSKLEIVAYSETEFYLPGFISRYRFVVPDGASEASAMVLSADGREVTFNRQ